MESARKIIGREVLASLATAGLFPFGFIRRKKRLPRAQEQRTLVFVHGYLSNPSAFLPLECYLRTHGIQKILFYEYSGRAGIEQAALGLKTFLKQQVRGGRIDLVCHSLGGLVARVYLQNLGGARRVDQCISLGAPNDGTYNAYWLTSRVARELRPGSDLLRRLEATRGAATTVRFLSIVAGSDNIILPRTSAHHRDDVVHLPGVGHLGMLFSLRAFRAVSGRLAQHH